MLMVFRVERDFETSVQEPTNDDGDCNIFPYGLGHL